MSTKQVNSVVVAVALSLVSPSGAVPLGPPLERIPEVRWELLRGTTFYQVVTTEIDQVLGGTGVTQKQTQVVCLSWTTEEKDAEGNWRVKLKFEAIQLDIDIGGKKISYDSTSRTEDGNPLARSMGAIIGAELTITISPRAETIKVEGTKDLLKKVVPQNGQIEAALNGMLNDGVLKRIAPSVFARVPGRVDKKGNRWRRKGDSWQTKETLKLGPMGRFDTTYKYTYEGKDGRFIKVSVAPDMRYHPPAAGQLGWFPVSVRAGTLTTEEGSTGTVRFDASTGRFESSELVIRLKGKVTYDVSGTEGDIELQQTLRTSIRVTDENPLKTKKPGDRPNGAER